MHQFSLNFVAIKNIYVMGFYGRIGSYYIKKVTVAVVEKSVTKV